MSLSVKAVLMKRGETDPEVRRFGVDQDVTTNHMYMRGKVVQVFPCLKNKEFDMFWKDSEKDLIAFSTDTEQTEALGYISDGIFKIYIKEKEKRDSADPEPNMVHPYVMCDGCNGSVKGFRFKCVVCPDYDLCSGCESKGLHTEHDMMRINTPRPQCWIGHGMFPPQGMPGFPPQHGPSACGSDCGLPDWRHMMQIWQQLMTSGKQSTEKGNESKDTEKKGDSETKGPAANSCPTDTDDKECGANPLENFLQNIGGNVTALLQSLGAEIDAAQKADDGACDTDSQREFNPWMWARFEPGQGRHCGQRDQCPEAPRDHKTEKPETQTDSAMETDNQESHKAASLDQKRTFSGPEEVQRQLRREFTRGLHPEVPTSAPSTSHSIANALDHMQAMGFNDEGGWLTHLLQVSGGDINKALDVIRANRNN